MVTLTSGGVQADDLGDDFDLGTGGGDKVYVQSGDVTPHSAVVWGRCNREQPARLLVELWEDDEDDEEYNRHHRHHAGDRRDDGKGLDEKKTAVSFRDPG